MTVPAPEDTMLTHAMRLKEGDVIMIANAWWLVSDVEVTPSQVNFTIKQPPKTRDFKYAMERLEPVRIALR